MKKVFIICILTIIVNITPAQHFSPTFSIYGGATINPTYHTNSLTKNGYNLGGNLYLPILTVKQGVTLGFNIGGEMYNLKNSFIDEDNITSQYQLQGASFESINQISQKKSTSSIFNFGVTSRITIGKLFVSPSINLGYFNQSISPNSITVQIKDRSNEIQQINLIEREKSAHKGIIIMPEAKFGCAITSKLDFYISSSCISTKELTNEEKVFIPLGGLNEKKTYTIVQMLNGSQQIENKSISHNFLNFNLGLSLKLGKSAHKNISNRQQTNKDNLIIGSIQQLDIKNVNTKPIDLYLNEKSTSVRLVEGNYKLIFENKLEAQDFNTTRSNRDNRLIVNPNGKTDSIPTRQQAQDFNTTRSNRNNRLIVNPNGKTDSIPTRQEAQNFNTTRSNRDNRLIVNPNRKTDSIPTRQEAQDFNTTRSNRDNRLIVNPNGKTDSIPTRQEAQDFNTTRSNRDNRLIVNPNGKTDSIPTRQEAQDFNTTRSNRDNRLIVNPRERLLVITNLKTGKKVNISILNSSVQFEIIEKGKYSFSIKD